MAAIWGDILRRPCLDPQQNFFEAGGDSLDALRLQAAVDERYGVDLPIDVLLTQPTVAGLAEWVERARSGEERDRALAVLQPDGTGLPLFCVPGIGGEPAAFRPLVTHLGRHHPVYGLRAQSDPAAATRPVTAIASAYLAEVLEVVSPDLPILLCGHSLGALIAFEMACQARAAGRRIGLLAIVDTPLRLRSWRSVTRRLRDVLGNVPAWIRYDALESGWRNIAIRTLGKAESASRRLFRRGRTEPAPALNVRAYFGILHPPARFERIMAARYGAACRYEPSRYPGSMILFRAAAQPIMGRQDRHLGWAELVTGGVRVFDVPGHHDSCLAEPHVRRLARHLKAELATLQP